MSPPRVPPMHSRVGLNVEGDNIVWGRSVRHDLMGRTSLTALVVLSATGRRLPPAECELLDDLATSLMATDTRIWPPKLGRIVAALGTTASGFCAAQLACASDKMGPLILGDAAHLLRELTERLGARVGQPEAIEAELARRLASGRRLPGFGAPFRPDDERLTALRESVARRGRADGPYWLLAERVAAAATRLRGLLPNIVLHGGALAMDVGLAPEEIGDVMLGLVVPLFLGTAREGARLREPQLRELPAQAVQYAGPQPRLSPRAQRGR